MAKKSFSASMPAEMFIDKAEPQEPTPQGYKTNYAVVETKSKRVQLLMQPSLYAAVKAKADAQGISFNEFAHKALEDATRG